MPAKKLTTAQKAVNTQKKLQVAKQALSKRSAQVKASKQEERDIASMKVNRGDPDFHYRANLKNKLTKEQRAKTNFLVKSKGRVSQAVTDRSRTATRATAIAKRVAKKK